MNTKMLERNDKKVTERYSDLSGLIDLFEGHYRGNKMK
jgi:hypothetical protein